jgi:lipopolysaccharide heptosyltransferase II
MTWDCARDILCVRLDSLGDVLMTTPAIRALKESVPGRRVTLLTSASGAGAARLVPEIDAIIEFAAPWMKPAPCGPAEDARLLRLLAEKKFDAAVVFTVYSQNPLPAAYLCWLAGIPLRLAHCHENPYHLLSDWVRDPEPAAICRHEVRRQLDLVGAIGCRTQDERLSFAIPAAAKQTFSRKMRRMRISQHRPLVVVHPGATAPSRRYPAEQFRAALNALGRQADCELLFTGDETEAELIDSIRSGLDTPSHATAGALSLAELGAAIKRASLLISNNTGPVHIAAALGTPVVDIYALTNPQHTPWLVESRVLFNDVPCRYCYGSTCAQGHHACVRGIAPDRVAEAALDLLQVPARAPVAAMAPRYSGLPAFEGHP